MQKLVAFLKNEAAIETVQHPPIEILDRWRMQLIVEHIVERTYNVPRDLLTGPRRGPKYVVFARHLAMYLLHIRGGFTRTALGLTFARDRRGVAYAIAMIELRRDADQQFDLTVTTLETAMQHSAALECAA